MSSEERDYIDYLHDVLDASQKAIGFCEGMEYADFAKDDKFGQRFVRDSQRWKRICGPLLEAIG